jgi:gliding-associated putative ABC transporter substrate-binding component GldG
LNFTDYKHNRKPVFYRFDLTKDNRYTSSTSLDIVKQVKEPLYKNIPARRFACGIHKTTAETQQLLEEFQAYNQNIVFEFINPLENEDTSMDNIKELYRKGLTPVNITVDDKGKQSQAMVFHGLQQYIRTKKSYPLLKNRMGATTTEMVIGSVQHLEYSISDALNKVTTVKQKTVAV